MRHSSVHATPPRHGDILLLGVDFASAPLSVRERLTYNPQQAAAMLRAAAAIDGLEEIALLSTCNRTEFYLVGAPEAAHALLAMVRTGRPGASPRDGGCDLRRLSGEAAVRHLFAVASGIESLIVGDAFILMQMRQAVAVASAAGTLGAVLSEAFRRAFVVGRRARATTDIARGDSGLGAVVAALVTTIGTDPRVLLVGAGTTATEIGRQMAKRGAGLLTVVNRSAARGEALARACGARLAHWDALGEEIRAAGVVICATAADVPIIRPQTLGRHRPLLIDVGVPRNIEPPQDATCLCLDDLVARQDDSRRRREAAVPGVTDLVEQSIVGWRRWLRARPVERLLKDAFARDRELRRQLAADLVAGGWRGTPDEAEHTLARWTRGVLRGHAAELRQWASGPTHAAEEPGPAAQT